ncbi:uncharacterized protein LOC133739909 [Rosa rugosa]|uniref:uncharacterized protein LOC133739909 n=1 Tax=Rosa rugosa TaxID=74645 RepID=UPI002B413C70|nr:uncharacterized protein LOC133739909 [Rosa rugosa]XP_062023710.1 uncharacterized protein LOC133739909 [Rosa rugosa]
MKETKAKIIPTQLTNALWACKNVLMQYLGYQAANQEDCKNDAKLQSFNDASLKTRTDEIVTKFKEDGGLSLGTNEIITKYNGGLSLDVLDNVLTSMSDLGQKTAGAILDFKSKTIPLVDDSYKLVVKEYLSSSLELLEFFTELEKFLDSARRSHSHIEQAIEECSSLGSEHGVGREEAKMISNKLSDIMASNVNDYSGEKLVEKARCLLEKQEEMFDKCRNEQEKLGKDQKSIDRWRKLMNYIFMGAKCLLYVVLLFYSVKSVGGSSDIVGDLKIKPAYFLDVCGIDRIVGIADHWTSSRLEVCQNDLVLKNDAMNTIKEGAIHTIKEMGDIKDLIGKVVNSIESLLASSTNVANGGNVEVAIKNIKLDLKKYLDKIEALEKKTGECSSSISKARQAVLTY